MVIEKFQLSDSVSQGKALKRAAERAIVERVTLVLEHTVAADAHGWSGNVSEFGTAEGRKVFAWVASFEDGDGVIVAVRADGAVKTCVDAVNVYMQLSR